MNRRDVLRMLTAGAVLPAMTPELFAFYRQAHPDASYSLRTLNPHQNDTVVAMIDQIIPATDTPGAKAARVNEFIDVILTEWATDEERRNFLDGLAEIAALFIGGPYGEDDVDEFVDAGSFGAGRIGGRNDLIDHGDDGIVLVRIQSA